MSKMTRFWGGFARIPGQNMLIFGALSEQWILTSSRIYEEGVGQRVLWECAKPVSEHQK